MMNKNDMTIIRYNDFTYVYIYIYTYIYARIYRYISMYTPSLSSASKHASNGFVTSGISDIMKTKNIVLYYIATYVNVI